MARRFTNKLKYWQIDLDVLADSRFTDVLKKFGVIGIFTYLFIENEIYRKYGYYLPFGNENERNEIAGDVIRTLIWSKHTHTPDEILGIIDVLIESDFFDKSLSNRILTSNPIQMQFYTATRTKTYVDIRDDYWLLKKEEMKTAYKSGFLHYYFISKFGPPVIDAAPIPPARDSATSSSDNPPLHPNINPIDDSQRELLHNLFNQDFIIDDDFKYSAELYAKVAEKWHQNPWLVANWTHLSIINKKFDDLISGKRDKFKEDKTDVRDAKWNNDNFVDRNISPEKLESLLQQLSEDDF